MIFLTVGTQLVFNRLTRAVDNWSERNPEIPVIAQIGPISRDDYSPKHVEIVSFLSPQEYSDVFQEASLIVSHVGMGTMITALLNQKSLIVLPRQASKGEHRNDHQIATARHFRNKSDIWLAEHEDEVGGLMSRLSSNQGAKEPGQQISKYAQPELIDSLRRFVTDP